jgi:RNA polymerase sigma-70 factor (subfamily 1)
MATESGPDGDRSAARLQRTELLVSAAQSRCHGAMDELVRFVLADLRAYVRLKLDPELRRRESCSDVVQSVCREVVEDLGGFDDRGAGSFRAWLFTAALNKIRQKHHHWAAEKRNPAREVSGGSSSDPDAGCDVQASLCSLGGSPSEHAIAHEQADRIERAMDRLTPEQREVLLLARLVGLSHREIAERTGRTEVAVRSLLSRGSLRLLAVLEARRRE